MPVTLDGNGRTYETAAAERQQAAAVGVDASPGLDAMAAVVRGGPDASSRAPDITSC